MAKQSRIDSLLSEIEDALGLDSFISYQQSWDYVRNLQNVKEKIDSLVRSGAAKQCVPLYEMFLSSCYEKADEIDDSGGKLSMFFEELFCSWLRPDKKPDVRLKKRFIRFSSGWTTMSMAFVTILKRTWLRLLIEKDYPFLKPEFNLVSMRLFPPQNQRIQSAFMTILMLSDRMQTF